MWVYVHDSQGFCYIAYLKIFFKEGPIFIWMMQDLSVAFCFTVRIDTHPPVYCPVWLWLFINTVVLRPAEMVSHICLFLLRSQVNVFCLDYKNIKLKINLFVMFVSHFSSYKNLTLRRRDLGEINFIFSVHSFSIKCSLSLSLFLFDVLLFSNQIIFGQ